MATADDETDTQTVPAPAATPAASLPPDMLGQALQLAQQYNLMPQQPQRDTTPVKRGWLSLLGEAIGGGDPTGAMTPAEQERAGLRSLMGFGTGLMAASRYQPGQTIFSNLAEGLQGAQRSELGSAQMSMAQLGAQQQWAQQQAQNRVSAIQAALPFLRLQAAQGIPNPLAGGGAPGGPNTSISAAAGQPLTGDIDKDRVIIAQRESGGDPTALNWVAKADPTAYARGATASGKYQFVNSTWQEGLKLAGIDGSKYPTAMSAPEKVQDQVFNAVYGKYGTAPWDASKFKQQWVPTPTGQMVLANAAPGSKPTGTATASAAPSAGQPGVQMGGPPPAPPGGSGAPSGGGGIGAALNPPAVAGSPIPAGKLQTTGKPPGVADIIQSGMKLAQGGLPAGTVTAAGPAAGTPPAASAAWGPTSTTTIGNYNAPGAAPAPTTTPPAQPAPQGATQADQPPTPPAVTTPPAGGPLTFEQFQQQHPIHIDPSTYAVTPPDLTAAIAAKNAAAQTLDLIHKGLSTADPNKATQAYTDAAQNVAKLQQEAQSKSLELQQAAQKNALDTQRQLYNDEMTRQQAAQLKAQELAQQVAENEKNRQAQINLENVKAGVATSQHLQEAYNTDAANSGKRIDDLELLRGLSDNAGSPTLLTSIKVGDRSLADIISATGFGGKDLQDKVGAIQAFRAGILNTVRELRTGGAATGEPRSNQDLQFVQDMAPNEWQSPATRGAIISFLQQVNQRRIDMAAEVSRLMATRGPGGQLMPAGEAVAQARKNLPDFVQTMPPGSLDNSPAGLAARKDFFSSIPPHSFFRYPNGRIDLYNGPGG